MRFPLPGRFVLTLPFASAPFASAQTTKPEDPISTVRPRLTDTARIVPMGRFQVEAGLAFGFRGLRINRRNDYGEAMVRYGVTPRLEARIELPTYSDYANASLFPGLADFPLDGFGDLSVSVSWRLGRVGPASIALRPRLTLPTGVDYRSVDEVSPSIFLTAEAPVGKGWAFGSTLGYAHARNKVVPLFVGIDGTVRYDTYRATLAAERAFAKNLSGFAEYVGDYRNGSRPQQFANAGVRFRTSTRTQVDLRLTSPIGTGRLPNFVGLGYSVRF